jgi:hypothetical protein
VRRAHNAGRSGVASARESILHKEIDHDDAHSSGPCGRGIASAGDGEQRSHQRGMLSRLRGELQLSVALLVRQHLPLRQRLLVRRRVRLRKRRLLMRRLRQQLTQ